MIFKKTESEFLQVAATRECNFTMRTILGKAFAQAKSTFHKGPWTTKVRGPFGSLDFQTLLVLRPLQNRLF